MRDDKLGIISQKKKTLDLFTRDNKTSQNRHERNGIETKRTGAPRHFCLCHPCLRPTSLWIMHDSVAPTQNVVEKNKSPYPPLRREHLFPYFWFMHRVSVVGSVNTSVGCFEPQFLSAPNVKNALRWWLPRFRSNLLRKERFPTGRDGDSNLHVYQWLPGSDMLWIS